MISRLISVAVFAAGDKGKFFCTPHYRQLFLSNPEAINYSRAGQGRRERVEQQEEEPMETSQPPVATEPVKPVPKLDRLVEEEEGGVAVRNGLGEREMETELPSSPVVIIEPPPVEEEKREKEKKRSKKSTFSLKKKKPEEQVKKMEEKQMMTEPAKEEAKAESEVREREGEREEEVTKNFVKERKTDLGSESVKNGVSERERDRQEEVEERERERQEAMEEREREKEDERERSGTLREREGKKLDENESTTVVQNGHFKEKIIESDKNEKAAIEGEREARERREREMERSGGEKEGVVANGCVGKGRRRWWGRETEREREEREIAREMERSTMQITTCHYGAVRAYSDF